MASGEAVRARRVARWVPGVLTRFADAVRQLVAKDPARAKRAGLVLAARSVLRASTPVREAMALDPALGRWTAALEDALADGETPPERLVGLRLLAPRLALGAALHGQLDLDLQLVVGSGGRARIPADGRVLLAPPGRAMRVEVRGGELATHARQPRRVKPFELADGDGDGGKAPRVQALSGGDAFRPQKALAAGVKVLWDTAPDLLAEAAALVPVLVAVRHEADVSHSVGLGDARGCVWLSAPERPLVVAETLLHEASHQLFHLVEDAAPFVLDPDPPRLQVPWRPDPRPLRAVLMGQHAWVRVLRWLRTLEGGSWGQHAAERIPVLEDALAAAEAAATGASGLTPHGEALLARLTGIHRGESG